MLAHKTSSVKWKPRTYSWGLAALIVLFPRTKAIADEQDAFLKVYGTERAVSIATGYDKPIRYAPSVATVITAGEMRAIGATTLDQALETVPGIHMTTSRNITSSPIIRGLRSELDAEVLVLMNGIPYGQSLTNTFAAFENFPTNNVERLEILRGPVSALYGADAFAGVINIVTKKAEGIHGTEVGTRLGAFDTYDGWLLHGGKLGPVDVALAASGRTTRGFEGSIEADAQTPLDRLFHTHASHAPGPVSAGRDVIDTHLDLSSGPLRLRASYFGQENVGLGAGFVEALDPKGHLDLDRFTSDLSYHDKVTEDLDLTADVSYYRNENTTDITLLPPGAFLGIPPGFPEGVNAILKTKEQQWRVELSTLYFGVRHHVVRTGLGYFHTLFDDVNEARNFFLVRGLFVPAPAFRSTQELGVDASFPTARRNVFYGFLQDEWQLAPDWTLTTGVRVDDYSDAGTTANPRVSLVWQTSYQLTTKLLYGRSFRAPSFLERFLRNNPVATGNPKLGPETLNNVDLVFDERWTKTFRTNLDLFWYRIQDNIKEVSTSNAPVTFRNGNGIEGYGMELESIWTPIPSLRLTASYAYQAADETGKNPGLAPHHQVYGETDWQFLPGWHINASVKSILDRERAVGDIRPTIKDYSLVDLTIARRNIGNHMDISFSARNLFDVDAREPSRSVQTIPNDLPTAGRNLYAEIRYGF